MYQGRIVALITVRESQFLFWEYGLALTLVFMQLKLYFNIWALFFSKFLHVKNRVYQWYMQKIIVSIFLIMNAHIVSS